MFLILILAPLLQIIFFQNLPELTELDLAYNSLREFDFDYFDQVGTLSALKVNCSHNKINELKDNSTFLTVRENGNINLIHEIYW